MDPHAVPEPDSRRGQRPGHAVRGPVQFGVGKRSAGASDGLVLGPGPGGVPEQLVEEVRHPPLRYSPNPRAMTRRWISEVPE